MAFSIQTDSSGNLIYDDGSKRVYIYGCNLHVTENKLPPGQGLIPSRASISSDSTVVDAVCPWQPLLLQDWDNKTNGLRGTFDNDYRSSIKKSTATEAKQQHLRYQFWQLYIFVGDTTTATDRSITSLWRQITGTIAPIYTPSSSTGTNPPPAVGP